MRKLKNGGCVLNLDEKLSVKNWLFHKLIANRRIMEIMEATRQGSIKPVSDELISYKLAKRAAIHEWLIDCLRNLGATQEEIDCCA